MGGAWRGGLTVSPTQGTEEGEHRRLGIHLAAGEEEGSTHLQGAGSGRRGCAHLGVQAPCSLDSWGGLVPFSRCRSGRRGGTLVSRALGLKRGMVQKGYLRVRGWGRAGSDWGRGEIEGEGPLWAEVEVSTISAAIANDFTVLTESRAPF